MMDYRVYTNSHEARMFRIYPGRAEGDPEVAQVPLAFLDQLMKYAGYRVAHINDQAIQNEGWAPRVGEPTEPRTFGDPGEEHEVKRYVTGEPQLFTGGEGDWQLYNEGHEGEETV